MPVLAVPSFLLAGVLAALVPLALHLVRRRPPVRAPLPTARFLAVDPRNAVRVSRPTDLPLLLLRMAMLVLLGLGLARPSWVPAPAGTAPVVLLDRSVGGDAWRAAVGEARSALIGADGAGRGSLVLFDTAGSIVPAARLTPALFDSLAAAPPSASADLAAGLRAIRPAVGALPRADSVRVRLVSSFTDAGWSPGLGAVRSAAWPGAIDLARVDGASSVGSLRSGPSRSALVIARQGGDFVAAALGAIGYDVARTAADLDAPPDVAVFVDETPEAEILSTLTEDGSTVVMQSVGPEMDAGGEMWFGDGLRLTDAGARTDAPAEPGGMLLAAWEGGGAAVTARPVGEGCIVEVRTALEGGDLPFQAVYPAAIDRLARGCEAAVVDARALDAGALALLAGRGPAAVAAGSVDPERDGTGFGRWILLAALMVAGVETWMAYRRRAA